MDVVGHNYRLHRVAMVAVWATFPLIFIGGLVTSKDAGMSVPDWPNTYGYNMFLFPPRLWTGNILYEHTHRLYASMVGVLTIVLAATAWLTERRRWVRWLGVSSLGVVILQGVLGGLRVVLKELDLAIVHACLAQAFFCLLMLVCVATSRWWNLAAQRREPESKGGRRLVKVAIATVAIVYAQLMVGATMRHYRAGLAIPDLPLAYGRVLPPTNAADLRAAQERYWEPRDAWWWLHEDRENVTVGKVWLAFGHRAGAVVVSAAVIGLAALAFRRRREELGGLAVALLVLLAAQVTLGVLTVYYGKPADVASAHVAVGALVLVTTFVIAVRAIRLYWPHKAAVATQGFEVGAAAAGRLNGAMG
jgi:heme a synthase